MPSLRRVLRQKAKAIRRQKNINWELRSINKQLELQAQSSHYAGGVYVEPEQIESLQQLVHELNKQLAEQKSHVLSQISKLESQVQDLAAEKATLIRETTQLKDDLNEAQQQCTRMADSLKVYHDELQEASKGQQVMALVCQVLQEDKHHQLGGVQQLPITVSPEASEAGAVFQNNACYEEDDEDDVARDQMPRDTRVAVEAKHEAPHNKLESTPSKSRIPRAPAVQAVTNSCAPVASKSSVLTSNTSLNKDTSKSVSAAASKLVPTRSMTHVPAPRVSKAPSSTTATPAGRSTNHGGSFTPDAAPPARRHSTSGAASNGAATKATRRIWV